MAGNEIIAKLKAEGWKLDRIHGSHHVMCKEGKAVPVPCMESAMSAPASSRPFPAKAA